MRKDSLECFQATSQPDVFHIEMHICLISRGEKVSLCGLGKGRASRGVGLEMKN